MITNPPPSPLHVSELGKFEESDLTPEMTTAKNERVTVSPRSWELTQGRWSSISSPGTAQRPRPSPAVLLGKPARRPVCSRGLVVQPPGPWLPESSGSHIAHGQPRAWGESSTTSVGPSHIRALPAPPHAQVDQHVFLSILSCECSRIQ